MGGDEERRHERRRRTLKRAPPVSPIRIPVLARCVMIPAVCTLILVSVIGIAAFASIGVAQDAGPYKVLKMAKVGGEGGWDYIYADSVGRRLYIPRRGSPTTAVPTRLSIYNLDTLELVKEIEGIGGNGTS